MQVHAGSKRALRIVSAVGAMLVLSTPTTLRAISERSFTTRAVSRKQSDSVVVSNAWARPALKGGTGGAYATITNHSSSTIRIVGATSAIAVSTELHASMVHDGMAHMEMVPTLVITSGASVSLKPGGLHFMLIGLRQALVRGDSMPLTLQLQSGKSVTVQVLVRAP